MLSSLSIAKPSPGSTKMHFSEPEISIFFLGEAAKHPPPRLLVITEVYIVRPLVITTAIYFQKFFFNPLHIFGKTLGPPYQKILDPPLPIQSSQLTSSFPYFRVRLRHTLLTSSLPTVTSSQPAHIITKLCSTYTFKSDRFDVNHARPAS